MLPGGGREPSREAGTGGKRDLEGLGSLEGQPGQREEEDLLDESLQVNPKVRFWAVGVCAPGWRGSLRSLELLLHLSPQSQM